MKDDIAILLNDVIFSLLIQCLGIGLFFPDLTPKKKDLDFFEKYWRYGTLTLITTDDHDGKAIRLSILQFLCRHQWPIVKAGRVYTVEFDPNSLPQEGLLEEAKLRRQRFTLADLM